MLNSSLHHLFSLLPGATPCLSLVLAPGGSAALPAKLPAQQPWLAVSPDSLAGARMVAGQHVLVGEASFTATVPWPFLWLMYPRFPHLSFQGLAQCGIQLKHVLLLHALALTLLASCAPCFLQVGITNLSQPSAVAGTPGGSKGSVSMSPASSPASSFAPVNVPSIKEPGTCVRSLWQLCSSAYGLTLASNPGAAEGSQQSNSVGTATAPAGAYLMAARVWPGSKVPRGMGVMSAALAECCGQAPAGSVLAVFPLSQSPSSGADEAAGAPPPSSTVVLRVVKDVARCIPAVLPPEGQLAGPSQSPAVSRQGSTSGLATPPPASKQGATPGSK